MAMGNKKEGGKKGGREGRRDLGTEGGKEEVDQAMKQR